MFANYISGVLEGREKKERDGEREREFFVITLKIKSINSFV